MSKPIESEDNISNAISNIDFNNVASLDAFSLVVVEEPIMGFRTSAIINKDTKSFSRYEASIESVDAERGLLPIVRPNLIDLFNPRIIAPLGIHTSNEIVGAIYIKLAEEIKLASKTHMGVELDSLLTNLNGMLFLDLLLYEGGTFNHSNNESLNEWMERAAKFKDEHITQAAHMAVKQRMGLYYLENQFENINKSVGK